MRACATNGDNDTYGVALQRSTVGAVSQLDGSLGKVCKTGDGEVLLVGLRSLNDLLSLLHAVEDVGLAILVAVGTDAQVDFAGVLVGLESLSDTCVTRRLENFTLLRRAEEGLRNDAHSRERAGPRALQGLYVCEESQNQLLPHREHCHS